MNSTISLYRWACSTSFAMYTFPSRAKGVIAIVFDWWSDLFMWVSDCRIGGLMWLDRWVSDLFTCCNVYFKFLGLSFFMWIWWFFWVYGFDLLEVSVEDRDFVCILSIGLLNVSHFSVWFERKVWFSREMLTIVRKIYEVGWVCCYCEPNWLGLCVFVSLEHFWFWVERKCCDWNLRHRPFRCEFFQCLVNFFGKDVECPGILCSWVLVIWVHVQI